jgi:capsule biosynthesis phosphatase
MFDDREYEGCTFVFDLDGTICPVKGPEEDYADLRPFPEMLERMRFLHARGAKLVINTSRNMRSYEGNLGKINKHTASTLLPWLDKWGVPYDELYYGKPWAGHVGLYIDDRAVRPDEFLSSNLEDLSERCKASRCKPSDENMAIVITMAGFGTRFRDAGYTVPKYEIEAAGKTLFEWSMDSLADYIPHARRIIFVVRKEDGASPFIRKECERVGIPSSKAQIIDLDSPTDGQATTCYLATDQCEPYESLLVYNIDTYVEPGALLYSELRGDGCIPCFHGDGDHWSFVGLGEDGFANDVREKERISDNCSIGAYWFRSVGLYRDAYDEYYSDDGNLVRGEKYIAPLYNQLIKVGMRVSVSDVDPAKVHVLGTPAELREFVDGREA